jgi:hypothetical protein
VIIELEGMSMGTLSFEPTGSPPGAFVHGPDVDDIDDRASRADQHIPVLLYRKSALSGREG